MTRPLSLTPFGGHPVKTDTPTDRWQRHRMAQLNSGATLYQLVTWCCQAGLEPTDVKVSGGHLQWFTPETDDEYAARQATLQAAAERAEAWERATLARLVEKYGAPS